MLMMCHYIWCLFFVQFEYTLTCAICTKPQEKEMRVLSRISQVSTTPKQNQHLFLYLQISLFDMKIKKFATDFVATQ